MKSLTAQDLYGTSGLPATSIANTDVHSAISLGEMGTVSGIGTTTSGATISTSSFTSPYASIAQYIEFTFPCGVVQRCNMGSSIRGMKVKGNRPDSAVIYGMERVHLGDREASYIMTQVYPALKPGGTVVFEGEVPVEEPREMKKFRMV